MDFSLDYGKKIKIIVYWIIFFLLIIISRLVYLQILCMHNFFSLGIKNFLRTESIASPRGNILDCKGNLLATNRPVTTLYWQGTGNKTFTAYQQTIIETIENIIGKLPENILSSAEKNGTKILIASDISFTQLSKIIELFPNNPNVVISTQFKRYYPNHKIASHILGHLSNLNNLESIGKMGLEKIVHDILQGTQGKILKTINSLGTDIEHNEIKTALAGQNITTTIDLSLQRIAESLFPQGSNGTLILMDPATGAIRSLVSRPDFDPTLFLEPIENSAWNQLQQNKPFLNRAFNACYPPASIFKLIVVSAALENNIITPQDTISCSGFFRFKGRRYHCMRRTGHGELCIKDAVAKSCNILFYEIATQLSIDTLADYAFKFGLGQKTNIIFPEQEGLVPTSAWKNKEKGEPWWPGETLSCSIGQSYLLSTPIQIACMISSIFEGYLVKPRILEHEPITIRPLDILFSTRKFLKNSMKSVVRVGTGMEVSHIEDIKIFAKTGTAQVTRLSQKQDTNETLPHAWFVAYFYYKDYKPLTLIILIENAGSTQPARIFAKKFLMRYRAFMHNYFETNGFAHT
jgi:penicillin-binding protein 2